MLRPAAILSQARAHWQRWNTHRAFRIGFDVAWITLALLALSAYQTRGHLDEVPLPAFALPALPAVPEQPALAGSETVSSASLRGKPALLAFFAPWCSACAAQSQNLSWVRTLVGARATVVAVALGYQTVDDVQAYVREHAVDYPVLLGDDALGAAFRIEAFPTLYFVDGNGRIKHSAAGYTTTLGMLWRLLL